MNAPRLADSRVLVVGMGRSGIAAVALLRRQAAKVRATDVQGLDMLPEVARELEASGVSFAVQSPEVFRDCDLMVLSPGVPADLPEVEEARGRGVRVVGEVELAGWFLEGPVIGITGSNGKTTTTALTGHILEACGIEAQVGGNIGNPPTNMVTGSHAGKWNVLELSSFQLETIERFRAGVAVLLNVTPDHLDRHHTMDAYIAAKRRIFETQQAGDAAVLNAGDAVCRSLAGAVRGEVVWFSSGERPESGFWVEDGHVMQDGEPLIPVADIPLRGRHNIENVMAASAAARLAGAEGPKIAAAIRSFPGVEHRLEYVATVGGVTYYNDSKATNVDATLKALDAFDGGLWVILGGKDKGSDYGPLRAPLSAKAKAALLIGTATEKIAGQLGDAVEQSACGTLEAAVREASRRAKAGETVLLAPACASFDQFRSYEHRGAEFKRLVAGLHEQEADKEADRCE